VDLSLTRRLLIPSSFRRLLVRTCRTHSLLHMGEVSAKNPRQLAADLFLLSYLSCPEKSLDAGNMSDSSRQWILVLSLTALLLSLAVLAQTASRYATAYLAAPREVSAFLDTVDSSIAENESYDKDVAKIQRLEDKVRLARLLRDIQSTGDSLREHLNAMVVGEEDTRLRMGARIFWAGKRVELEEKVRRLDLLRMRFLVVHMGIIATAATEAAVKQEASARDPEKLARSSFTPSPSPLSRSLTDSIKSKPPLRRLTTQTIGHYDTVEGGHRKGWAGVVSELQKSPLLHKRHASIEMALTQTQTP